MITSPYNFVPLSNKVVMPFWAKHINHDIPFKNQQSGKLKLKIKAESPIFIRNGMPRDAKDNNPESINFNHFNNRYFIPGSSVKGMLRSVVEIMSFGRMKNKVNPDKYSVRDFTNTTDKGGIYPLRELSQKVECGWLYKEGDEYYIDKCGRPGRISHKNIDTKLNTNLVKFFSEKENLKKSIKIEKKKIGAKSARFKYEYFQFEPSIESFSADYESGGKTIYKIDNEGSHEGKIVFTGQSGERYFNKKWNKWEGKHLEFIFWDKEPTKTPVSDERIKNFFFAYYNHDKNQQKEDWKWRKPQLDRGEKIPVFYRTDDRGQLVDMGLSMLYKITYNNSILDAINHQQAHADSYDLAEAIFGYTEEKDALKGRVHIGHAFAKGDPKPLPEKNEVLAGPKASYYPNYIEQKNPKQGGTVNGYKTFMDDSAKIRGWKRYPVHSGDVKRNSPPEIKGRVNEKVASKFKPLPKGTEFELEIAYHNLRKEELGALLSAATFHNTTGLYHSIGSAKPLGYGKISIEIEELDEKEKIEMLKAYETFMDYELADTGVKWLNSPQITELFIMAKENKGDEALMYMKMKKKKEDSDPLDFETAKKEKLALQKYSMISQNEVTVIPLASNEDLQQVERGYKEEEEELKKLDSINSLKEDKEREEGGILKNKIEELQKILLKKLSEKKDSLKSEEGKKKEIGEGINLMGVRDRKTIDALGRTLKRWVEKVGGEINENTVEAIKTRLKEVNEKIRPKQREKWQVGLIKDLPKLETYLNNNQINDIKEYINSLN